MAWSEDDWIPVAALQHFVFCPRQWGLIHLEGIWADNRQTAEGNRLHQQVDIASTECRGDVRIARAVPIRSVRLGLTGKADVVEFLRCDSADGTGKAVALADAGDRWIPHPVEYKRGAPKPWKCDEIQLCTQALCIEEMLECDVPQGALFYGQTRRRVTVLFDAALRQRTIEIIGHVREASRRHALPPPISDARCDKCSLNEACMPKLTCRGNATVTAYLDRLLQDASEERP